ncbi:MAG: electron transfer flavoprotein subunit alpha/FixB family protein, partial [Microbacterium sp.]
MTDFAADSILVVLDVTPAGELASSSAGLLGAAAQAGTPVALVVAAEERHDALTAAAGAP